MAQHVAKAFCEETVRLDGQAFIDCEFKRARMVFEGGEVPTFSGCHFDECDWRLEGAADRTLKWLAFLHGSGNKSLVEGILRLISRQ